MKVTYYQPFTFELSDKDKIEAAFEVLKSIISPGEYLETKKDSKLNIELTWLCRDEDYYHGSPSTDYLRVATELDLAVFKVRTELRKRYEKLQSNNKV